jgi:diguanylate cyclase (GGDEF)-like protein/PAS domain S-box-containing protein
VGARVLVIDDDPAARAEAARLLREVIGNVVIEEIADHVGFFKALKNPNMDLVVSEQLLHWSSGEEVVVAVKSLDPALPVMILTAEIDAQAQGRAREAGVSAWVTRRENWQRRFRQLVSDILKIPLTGSGHPVEPAPAAAPAPTPTPVASVPMAPAEPPLRAPTPASPPEPAADARPTPPDTPARPTEFPVGALGIGAFRLGADGELVWANPLLERLLATGDDPEAGERLRDAVAEALGADEGPVMDAAATLDTASGSVMRVRMDLARVESDAGDQVIGLLRPDFSPIDLGKPVPRLDMGEDAEVEPADVFETVVERMRSPLALANRDGFIVFANPAFADLAGRSAEELTGGLGWTELLAREDAERESRMLASLPEQGQIDELSVRRVDGRRLIVSALRWWMTGSDLLVLSLVDLTERRQAEEQLLHTVYHDPLTRLPNRARVMERLEDLVAAGRPDFGLLLIDVDRFRAISDTWGAETAAQVLQAIAGRLKGSVGPADTIANLGNDLFGIILAPLDGEDACSHSNGVLRAFERPFTVGERQILCSASLGLALWNEGEGATDLYRRAERAVHHAKIRGRNRLEMDGNESDPEAGSVFKLERELRDAVAAGDLDVSFQPVVRLEDQEIVSVEALLRWNHPDRGRLDASAFLGIAEHSGLIVPIGRFVLGRACREAARWNDGREEPIQVTVNLSPQEVRFADLRNEVRTAIADSGLGSDQLGVEVPVSLAAGSDEEWISAVTAVADAGVRLVVDRYGATVLGEARLSGAGVDTVKLDVALMNGIADDEERWTLLGAVVGVARRTGARVVVTGVEDEHHRQRLIDLGATYGQGRLFGEPMPAEALTERL